MRPLALLAISGVALAGCQTTPADLRWANKDDPVTDKVSAPNLSIRSTARPEKKDPPPVSPERAAAAAVTEIGHKTANLKEFKDATAKTEKAATPQLDWLKLPRTLAVSVERPGYRPADRYVKYVVHIHANNFVFSDIKSVSTVYQSIDLGSLETKSEKDAGFSLAPTFGGSIVGIGGITGSSANTSDFTRKFAVRVQDPDIQVSPTDIRILREGAEDRDITGTTTTDLSVQPADYKKVRFRAIVKSFKLEGEGGLLTPEKTAIDTDTLQYMDPLGLQVCAKITYYDRVVKTGFNHYSPSVQNILPLTKQSTKWQAFVVVEPNEMGPNLWGIRDRLGRFFDIVGLEGPRELTFADPVQADHFRRWMVIQQATHVGTSPLQLPLLPGAPSTVDWSDVIVWPVLQPAGTVAPDEKPCHDLQASDDAATSPKEVKQ